MTASAKDIRELVHHSVGAFFRNCIRDGITTCAVCCGPTPNGPACSDCLVQQTAFGSALADKTLMLTYVQGYLPTKHQSAHVLRNYKDMGDPSLRSQLSLVLMGLVAYHIKCIRRWAGGGWHLVTYVPSRRTSHPLAAFAELMGALIRADRIELVPGPSFGGGRIILPDTFVVPPGVDVSGKRVLILEDTWVSGSKVQSAAMAVKLAGATHVTTLCIGRWLSAKLPAHADFIETRLTPGDTYDAAVCPVFPTHMCGSGTAA